MDVLGHWELTLIQRWRVEGMFVFHLLCKVSSDYRWIKQKELYSLSFETVLEVLVVMVSFVFGKILTLTFEAHVLGVAYQAYAQLSQ